MVKRILDDRPFFILPDDGLSIIPYGYTDNLAHAMLLAVDRPEASMGEIFNCGDDEKLTIRQVVEIITDELGHDWELLSVPGDLALPARPLMQNYRTTHRYIDTTKLRDRLGYRDVVPARSGRPPCRQLAGGQPARARWLRGVRAAGPVRLRAPRTGWQRGGAPRSPTRPTSGTPSCRATGSPTPGRAPAWSGPTPGSDPWPTIYEDRCDDN